MNTGGPPPNSMRVQDLRVLYLNAHLHQWIQSRCTSIQFSFTQRMVGGTIYIPNVFLVDTITTTPKTQTNIVKNGGGETD